MSSEYEYLHSSSREGQIKILIENVSFDQKPFIKAAYEYVVKKNKIEKEDNADLIVDRILALAKKISEEETANLPEKIIVSKELIKRISPMIKNIRKELFSQENPLFPYNPKKALEWLKRESDKRDFTIPENNIKKSKELRSEILKRMEELEKLTHLSYSLDEKIKTRFLPFLTESGWRRQIPAREGTPLGKFKEEIRKLSENYNFTQSSLISYVLTGIEPIVQSYKVNYQKRKINIEIHRPLRKGEIDNIFQETNKLFGEERKKISEKHRRLYELVEKYEGPPNKKKKEFWDMILKEWNENNPNDEQYSTRNCMRITYNRLLKYTQNQTNILEKFMTDCARFVPKSISKQLKSY